MSYVIKRLLSMTFTLILISIITFVITNILPGDVAIMIMGTQSNPEALANLRENLGLNDTLFVQYGNWVLGILQGDLGTSLLFKMPIGPLLLQKITSSALIVALSMSVALLLEFRWVFGRQFIKTDGRTILAALCQ